MMAATMSGPDTEAEEAFWKLITDYFDLIIRVASDGINKPALTAARLRQIADISDDTGELDDPTLARIFAVHRAFALLAGDLVSEVPEKHREWIQQLKFVRDNVGVEPGEAGT